MLLDKVEIHVRAGNGGNGSVSFRREKYVSHGGPDGGDGGRGGNIVVTVAPGENTLVYYKSRRKFAAGNGGDGSGGKIHGKNADDVILPVPPGTVIRDASSGLVIKDMSDPEPFVLCKGGRGGWGNRHFATPTRQIPRFAKSGTRGEEKDVILELKMIADVGIIGLPNVGKSTLLSVISSARPKIADYSFTTLSPNIGVVYLSDERSFVAADIPGLISGASEGAGLGFDFLRHIQRCRMFVHIVDVSDSRQSEPEEAIETVNGELFGYDPELCSRPQIVVANKTDALTDPEVMTRTEKYCSENGYGFFSISAAAHTNVPQLLEKVWSMLTLLPPVRVYESEIAGEDTDAIIDRDNHDVEISVEDGVYFVGGEWLYNLVGSVNFEDKDSLRYFQKILRKSGVIDRLREAGCTDGDTVSMYGFEFDFID